MPALPTADPLALRIGVEVDGPVGIACSELAAAGWDLSTVDPVRVSLYHGEVPYALDVVGADDGHLDPTDRIVFQGTAMGGEYTIRNAYWLVPAGEAVRFGTRAAPPGGESPPVDVFTRTLHAERDTVYYLTMHYRDGDSRWIWGDQLAAGDRRDAELTVPALASGAQPARMRVRLQGYTDDRAADPDHHVRIVVNGRVAHEARFDGFGTHDLSFVLPPGLLVEDDNYVTVESLGVAAASVDQFFLDWFEVDYASKYRATSDRLDFPGRDDLAPTFVLAGFASRDVGVLDVTDPARPVRLTGVEVSGERDGTHSVRLTDPRGGSGSALRRDHACRDGKGRLRGPQSPIHLALDGQRRGLHRHRARFLRARARAPGRAARRARTARRTSDRRRHLRRVLWRCLRSASRTVVRKILAYESGSVDDAWRRRAILVADDDNPANYEAFSEKLAAHLPPDGGAMRFYAAAYPRERDLTADIRAAVDSGALWLNSTGHANVDTWSPWVGGRIFQNANIAQLANGDRLGIFTSASCMTGWISHPLKPVAMSELWLTHAGGGGIAAYNSSGLEPASGAMLLLGYFYDAMYEDLRRPVGGLAAEAVVRSVAWSPGVADVVRQYVLLGDPALSPSGRPPSPPSPPTSPGATPPVARPIYLPVAEAP